MNLYGLRAETAAVESSGQAKAEAEVRNVVPSQGKYSSGKSDKIYYDFITFRLGNFSSDAKKRVESLRPRSYVSVL